MDIEPQPRYPYEFIQADALEVLRNPFILRSFDGFHASPPCGGYSNSQSIQKRNHPKLIDEVRDLLRATGKPYVIENVMGAPLRRPLFLCGTMFEGLRVYRHRIFETNFPVVQPPHPPHVHPVCKIGRPPKEGEWIQLVGNFTGADEARMATGLTWLGIKEMREAIPPAFTQYIGRYMQIGHIE